ncbi:SELO family protein [Abortiporus biennis]
MSTISTGTKFTLASLPLPPSSHILTHNLTPDPNTPSPTAFANLQRERPSIQRRARILAPEAHFSYVSPLPIGFPYRITPEEDEEIKDQQAFVEKWLSDRESVSEYPKAPRPTPVDASGRNSPLKKLLVCKIVYPILTLEMPFDTLGSPTLTKAFEDEPEKPPSSESDIEARQELIDVLSGHVALMSVDEDSPIRWAPWSLRYSGHQFGVWAGQLGDGRAISILATPHPEDPDTIYELQLKGAGRTPFSRGADGLAVVRSSIREFLGAEAMNALGIPTTRSLSLISLPATPVLRERQEAACVVTRMAPSFIRIGSFEALNPPASMFFFGGGQQEKHLDALRVLGEWVGRRVLRLEDVKWRDQKGEESDPWGRKLVLEVAKRNAKMVAGWQAYGFMHGVINTDNVSVLGLTIDYGPYAFMDKFDPFHICNHSDEEGRYAYNAQPSMIIYALRSLLNALAPLIGAEAELGKAVAPNWADNVSEEKIKEWTDNGIKLVKVEMETLAQETCAVEYGRLMHKRLALRRIDSDDDSKICKPLLDIMQEYELDFHSTFRRLAFFRPSMITPENTSALEDYISGFLTLTSDGERIDKSKAIHDLRSWFEKYAARIENERNEWVDVEESANERSEVDVQKGIDLARENASKSANPRFVLRQWVLEEVIKAVEKDSDSGKRILGKVLQMSCSPFEPWGAENTDESDDHLDSEIKEERRYCGMGEKRMLGFQCSCSS